MLDHVCECTMPTYREFIAVLCSSVMQCVAVFCGVLQYIEFCVRVCDAHLQMILCSVVQCVAIAVLCSVLLSVAVSSILCVSA